MNVLGPPKAYTDILDHAIIKDAKPFAGFPLRPSSSGKCTRELAFELEEWLGLAEHPKEVKSPETIMLLDLGNAIEWYLIRWFRKCDEWFKNKYKQQTVEFYTIKSEDVPEMSFLIEGSVDSCFWSDKYKGIIDYKTKKDKFDKAFKTNWDATDELLSKIAHKFSETGYYVDNLPKFLDALHFDPYLAANFKQLNGYACTKFLQDRGIDHGCIIQYNKNDSRKREIRFRPSMEVFEQVKQKFQTALDSVVQGSAMLAPKDFTLGSMKCGFCPYKDMCWPGDDTKKAYFQTQPPKYWPKDLLDRQGNPKFGTDILELFESKEVLDGHAKELEITEDKIVKKLLQLELKKVKLPNGHIYRVKELKSPYRRHVLRRDKL